MLAALILAATLACQSETSLPIVVETVDEIALVHIGHLEACDTPVIVFIRDGMVLDTRNLTDDMLFVAAGDSFELHWADYWAAQRIVITARVGIYHFEEDPRKGQDNLEWWNWRRPMRCLRAAP